MNINPSINNQSIAAIGTALVTILSFSSAAQAENLAHTQQLLATRQCPQCDLSNAGLVFANLSGANLSGANLIGANLSQANLTGADLRGANLTGAALYGANLSGARLDGANFNSADLRTAYVVGANLQDAVLTNTLLRRTIGLPSTLVSAADFYRWGLQDTEQRNFGDAIENYSQALIRKPDSAYAYLGRAVARYQNSDQAGAIGDFQQAKDLFKQQGNLEAAKVAEEAHKQLTDPPRKKRGIGFAEGFLSVVGGLLQVALSLL
ncbi:pentapeptide repeat-containing protein [Pantanalinema rosaneae CENA516]|uniref:pentapeptide repeat-containing protein n=1 Tax=Pantanalinema rosaneae TaxID=1620701 RepID=UPI003D6EAA58